MHPVSQGSNAGPEAFLPLDFIQNKPLKEWLRNITTPKGVHLLYDKLKYDPPEIKKAALFVTNNSLVCETPDDAMKVAYEMDDGERYDAVALDGTFYQKSGIISGGSMDAEDRNSPPQNYQTEENKEYDDEFSPGGQDENGERVEEGGDFDMGGDVDLSGDQTRTESFEGFLQIVLQRHKY